MSANCKRKTKGTQSWKKKKTKIKVKIFQNSSCYGKFTKNIDQVQAEQKDQKMNKMPKKTE